MLEKFKKVDWLGSFLFIASLTSFLIPITWVSSTRCQLPLSLS